MDIMDGFRPDMYGAQVNVRRNKKKKHYEGKTIERENSNYCDKKAKVLSKKYFKKYI